MGGAHRAAQEGKGEEEKGGGKGRGGLQESRSDGSGEGWSAQPGGARESRAVGLAVGAVTLGLIAMASGGRLHSANRRYSVQQLAAFEALWGPDAPRGILPLSGTPWGSEHASKRGGNKRGVDYRASAESILADKGDAAFLRPDGRIRHYLPKHEAKHFRSALHTQNLDEEAPAEEAAEDHGSASEDTAPGARVPLQEVDFTPPKGFDYKVPVEVYMESQGQASKLFTEWVLVQVVGAPGMTSIINLMMFPWGQCHIINTDLTRPVNVDVEYIDNYTATNVTLRSGWPAFLCEHGPSECEGNAIMSCVTALYPKIEQWFRVNACIVSRTCADGEAPLVDSVAHTGAGQTSVCQGLPVDLAPQCIDEFGGDMSIPAISQCVKGRQGTELLLQNMVQTQTLMPPIQMLPWVLVDDEVLNYPNKSHIFLLGKSICDAYIRKVQPYINGSVPRPLGCYYFPTEPPYMPPITLWDEQGILLLWVGGGVCFLLGVCILIAWKYFALQHNAKYERLEEDA